MTGLTNDDRLAIYIKLQVTQAMLKIIYLEAVKASRKKLITLQEEFLLLLSEIKNFLAAKEEFVANSWHLNVVLAWQDFKQVKQNWLKRLYEEYHQAIKENLHPVLAKHLNITFLTKLFILLFAVNVSLFGPQAVAKNKKVPKMSLKKLLRKNFNVVTTPKQAKKINAVTTTEPSQKQLPSPMAQAQPLSSENQPAETPMPQPAAVLPTPKPKTVAGWLPSWDTDEGLKTLTDFKAVFNEVSPFWYGVDITGQVAPSPGAENSAVIDTARADGDRLIPTVANAFDGQKISEILHDPNRFRWHIALLVDKAVNNNYDGIDLDYENLKPEDRDLYSQFASDLAQALHAKGKLLTVTVQPKTQEPGEIPTTQAHNYAALGQAADYIRIMAYDKHYSGGPPGPVAPVSWVDQVIGFAVTQIPKEKIILGIPTYGYDWPLIPGSKGKSVVHDQAAAISFSRGAPVNWDQGSATPFINYNDGTANRVIWFENAQSIQAKVDLVKKYDLAGVVFWRLGREDKSSYLQLSEKLNVK